MPLRVKPVICTDKRSWSMKMRIFLEQAMMMILVVTIMAAALAGVSLLTNLVIS